MGVGAESVQAVFEIVSAGGGVHQRLALAHQGLKLRRLEHVFWLWYELHRDPAVHGGAVHGKPASIPSALWPVPRIRRLARRPWHATAALFAARAAACRAEPVAGIVHHRRAGETRQVEHTAASVAGTQIVLLRRHEQQARTWSAAGRRKRPIAGAAQHKPRPWLIFSHAWGPAARRQRRARVQAR